MDWRGQGLIGECGPARRGFAWFEHLARFAHLETDWPKIPEPSRPVAYPIQPTVEKFLAPSLF
jgi:hypothetical protein